MANQVKGVRTISLEGDREGNLTYKVRYLVQRTNVNDDPTDVLTTPGLPTYGDSYSDGKGSTDPWAFCTQEKSVRRHQEKEGEVDHWWTVDRTFSTRPPSKRCTALELADPLDTPPEIEVSFVRYTEEATEDYLGKPIMNSAHEFIRGKQNEWDMARGQIKIKQNVSDPQLPALCQMVETVNKYEIWGFPPRTVKLSEAPVVWKFLGNCTPFYERTTVFDVRYRAKNGVFTGLAVTGTGTEQIQRLIEDSDYDTFDKFVMDEGTKVLNGHWDKATGAYVLDNIAGGPPDPLNPQHFIRFVDRQDKPTRVILDGTGKPANTLILTHTGTGTLTTEATAGRIFIQFYGESDFALLERLPTSLVPVIFP